MPVTLRGLSTYWRPELRGFGRDDRLAPLTPNDDPLVDHRALTGHRLEVKGIARDLGEQEGAVAIVPGGNEPSGPRVAFPELGRPPHREVMNPLLRAEPLVDVLVAREHDVD